MWVKIVVELHIAGEKLLGLYAAEYVYMRFPNLPAASLRTMTESYTGFKALKDVANSFGVVKVMRWKGTGKEDRAGEGVAAARVLQALIGALHKEQVGGVVLRCNQRVDGISYNLNFQGPEAARRFIHAHFLSRKIEPQNHFRVERPGKDLNFLQLMKGHPKPIPR